MQKAKSVKSILKMFCIRSRCKQLAKVYLRASRTNPVQAQKGCNPRLMNVSGSPYITHILPCIYMEKMSYIRCYGSSVITWKLDRNLHMPQTDYDKRLKFSISLFIKCQIIVCVQWGEICDQRCSASPRFPFVICNFLNWDILWHNYEQFVAPEPCENSQMQRAFSNYHHRLSP